MSTNQMQLRKIKVRSIVFWWDYKGSDNLIGLGEYMPISLRLSEDALPSGVNQEVEHQKSILEAISRHRFPYKGDVSYGWNWVGFLRSCRTRLLERRQTP